MEMIELTREEAKMVLVGFNALDAASRSDEPDLSNSSEAFRALRNKVREFVKVNN